MANIHEIIAELNRENGSNHKMATLKKYKDDALFARVLKMTYDKAAYTYGISVKHWRDPAMRATIEATSSSLSFEKGLDYLEDKLAKRVHTGHAALDGMTSVLKDLNNEDMDLLLKVLNRDLRINTGRTTINKVFGKLITKPVYMRCDLYSKKTAAKFKAKGSFIQLKADGTYREFVVEDGVVSSNSRSGEDYEYPLHFEEMKNFPNGHYFGELTVVRDGRALPRAEGNGEINSLTPPHEDIVFDAWDYVTREEYSDATKKIKGKTKYRDRFAKLKEIIKNSKQIRPIESHEVNSLGEALEHVMRWMNDDLEGGIWKDGDAVFQDGTSRGQLKVKLEIALEVRLKGFQEGTPGTVREKTFGAVLFETDDGQIKGRCSGFTNDQLEDFNSRREELIDQVFTVMCNDITKGRDNDYYALSHPRFIELRDDKNTTDTLESALKQKQMSMDLQ